MAGRIVSWYHKLNHAVAEARLRQMPILEVIQPKGERPLYGFGKQDSKRYYVVTSAPKTLLAEFAKRGIKAKQLPDRLMVRKAKKKRRTFAWA